MKSMYELIADVEIDSLEYFKEIKVYNLFEPIIEMKDVEKEVDSVGFKYSEEDKIKLIKFIVCCFSKDSAYLKTSDTVYITKQTVSIELEMSWALTERCIEYKIPELESCIKYYIEREDNEYIREYFIARNIYDRNLFASGSACDALGNIDVRNQEKYFEAAEKFRDKMYQLKQNFTAKNYMHEAIKTDFYTTVKSCFITDLVR